MSLLQGPGSVQGLAHAGVFAEEGFAVVLDPVDHLDAAKRHRSLKNLHRRLKLILLTPAAAAFFFFSFFFIQVSVTKRLRAHELKIREMKPA